MSHAERPDIRMLAERNDYDQAIEILEAMALEEAAKPETANQMALSSAIDGLKELSHAKQRIAGLIRLIPTLCRYCVNRHDFRANYRGVCGECIKADGKPHWKFDMEVLAK